MKFSSLTQSFGHFYEVKLILVLRNKCNLIYIFLNKVILKEENAIDRR